MTQANTGAATTAAASQQQQAAQPQPPGAARTDGTCGLFFRVDCAGMWGPTRPARYHPLLVKDGWHAFLADAATRYVALQTRVDRLPSPGNWRREVPVQIRLPAGLVDGTGRQLAELGPALGGDDPKWSLASFEVAIGACFPDAKTVMVYIGPIDGATHIAGAVRATRGIKWALTRSRIDRRVIFCVDSLGVGPSFAAMQWYAESGLTPSEVAVEPAPICEGFTAECYGCSLTTGNWRSVGNHPAAVKSRAHRVWLLTGTGDDAKAGELAGWVRGDRRVQIGVHNDGWDKPIIDAIIGE